jgi:hypothetical protein
LAVAKDQGLDEGAIADADDRGRTLSPRHRAALALADAELSQPGALPVTLVEKLDSHFTRAELIELTLDVMKWSYQKVPVALGVDREVNPGELTDLTFDADGNPVR